MPSSAKQKKTFIIFKWNVFYAKKEKLLLDYITLYDSFEKTKAPIQTIGWIQIP